MSKRILLVEDDPQTVELMTLRLESLACEVIVANDAETAFSAARAERPAFILADLVLSNGLEEGRGLLDRLATDPETKEIPVYVHSVYVSHKGDMSRIDAPATGFLLKPLRVPDLRALVDQHLADGTSG